MKPNKVRFEFLKTNKGNWVINYEHPDVGFNLHGKPEEVRAMYQWLIHGNSNIPRSHEFEHKYHYLVEEEYEEEDIENESE